jgi:ComF family protein
MDEASLMSGYMARLPPAEKSDSILAMHATLSRVGRFLVDAVFPPQCPCCGGLVSDHAQLCAACWKEIRFIGEPVCDCCGVPLEFGVGEGGLCLPCMAHRPAFNRARSVMLYDASSRRLVLALKHGDRLDPAPVYAGWMHRAGRELLEQADFVAPVPLHWRRLIARRYNQSALLADHVSRLAERLFVPDLLVRIRATPSQGAMNRKDRARNVRGAFAVSSRYATALQGRNVVLIDDVLTTGATVEGCAQALLRAGAARVDVLTLARVALADRAAV